MKEIDLRQYYRIETEIFVELSRFEQRRKHKRPRINKKWRKRYGFISERFNLRFCDYNAELFKKYDKNFIVEGAAIPQKYEWRFAVMEPTNYLKLDYDQPSPVAASYEVKTVKLEKFGCRLCLGRVPYDLDYALREVRRGLETEINKLSKSIDLAYDVLSAEIIE